MLTGDKQETAIEIGKACNLIREEMDLQVLSAGSAEEFGEKMEPLQETYVTLTQGLSAGLASLEASKQSRSSTARKLGIVIDGATLVWVLGNEALRNSFFRLGFVADSCICCRVTPGQKAEIVKLAKTSGKWVTLSIGDGANDVSMIQEAHIGVGIAGREGAQAVQASDFAFSQFRFLQRLLLAHGRWNYRRISWFVCYYFYKNITVVCTELCFAFFNGFSGQIYFADWLPQLYNSFWTSWPCMFTYVYERDLDVEHSLQFPVVYGAGQRSVYFTFTRFWTWIGFAVCHGLLCFWIPFYGMRETASSDGLDTGLWVTSTLSFTLLIHVVTYKLFLECIFWSKINM